jgi:hypothetical protein
LICQKELQAMLTRVAVFEGALETGSEDAFFANVEARLEPVWRSFPNVQAVRVLRTKKADPGAIPVVMVLEMDFAAMADIDDSLASDIKTKAHAATLEVLKPFTGRFFHFITESWRLAVGSGA